MITSNRTLAQLLLALGVGVVLGCCAATLIIGALIAQPIVVGALVKTPTVTPTAPPRILPTITLAPPGTRAPLATLPPQPLPTLPPLVTATPSVTVTATRLPPPPAPRVTPRPVAPHFLMARPVSPPADRLIPAPTYLYGTTSRGDYDVHHGEEFVNATGTPLYAVGDGVIVTAGNDTKRICGDDGKKTCGRDINFYGNVVVIKLDRDYNGQPVFALYGHMNKFGVNVGDRVKPGDVIGEVGMSGIALGPHVHFEVRIGVNDYAHTHNPILWMTPLAGRGAIVGRFSDNKGELMRGAVINLYSGENETLIYSSETYSRDDAPPVNSDDVINENFAFPDLTPGDYILRVGGQQYAARVPVEAGKLTLVELGGP